jgi:hypothetical protein
MEKRREFKLQTSRVPRNMVFDFYGHGFGG